jgi:hypothetical protein
MTRGRTDMCSPQPMAAAIADAVALTLKMPVPRAARDRIVPARAVLPSSRGRLAQAPPVAGINSMTEGRSAIHAHGRLRRPTGSRAMRLGETDDPTSW